MGVFPFSGGKQVFDGNPVGKCKAFIYVMHVAEELPSWPESKDRQRIWVSAADPPTDTRVGRRFARGRAFWSFQGAWPPACRRSAEGIAHA